MPLLPVKVSFIWGTRVEEIIIGDQVYQLTTSPFTSKESLTKSRKVGMSSLRQKLGRVGKGIEFKVDI